MKWFREHILRASVLGCLLGLMTCVSLASVGAAGGFPRLFSSGHGLDRWIENVPAGSEIEKALYRVMQLPGGEILFRRTPHESVPELSRLQTSQRAAALYSLRALEEEQALDFASAERDWRAWADQADDKVAAHMDLADFYERRLEPGPEIAALEFVGNSAPDAKERWTAVELQRSWKAFERALKVREEYALPRADTERIYTEWVKRYSDFPEVYSKQFEYLLAQKEWNAAAAVADRYRVSFPADRVFPVKAEAELARRRGQAKDGLAVYDTRFEPLWPAELIKDYFGLVIESHNQRAFADGLRAKLAADPNDLKDATRLFYLTQQQGQLDAAKAVLAHYREQKETRGASWTAEELGTLEYLYESIQDFPEAARYAYALAADKSVQSSEQRGVVALTRILLTAPEQPLRVGAGNLALYKNIATMDRGPGYLNGILSLWLNTQRPEDEYANEDQLALPYFHRARAAELLAQIDQRFPNESTRPQLHASLMEAYAVYSENQSVIREGTGILAQFPQFGDRVRVALELADAYERTKEPEKEFAVYRQLLKELSDKADGIPLGESGDAYSKPIPGEVKTVLPVSNPAESDSETVPAPAAAQTSAVRSVQYNEVLNRYLARLVSLQRLPDALNVLRGELDRNPHDPGLYQKLADFLQQNRLNSHEEEVYQRAIQEFQDTSWYAKLARFYLRQRRNADYRSLTNKAAVIFSGTELETLFQNAPAPDRSLAHEVNLYAHQRFPHDLNFVQRLIAYYGTTGETAEAEKLLWEHWWESPELRNQLFARLSSNGRLGVVLQTLNQQSPEIEKADWKGLAERNPAAERFFLEAALWQSHFEEGVGAADALAAAYPADAVISEQASSLYRSLAYFRPEDTDKAVAIQKRLLETQPGNLETLARIGDIYADRERFAEAAPYWVRMSEVHPGESQGYLQSATVFWDYFDFASAQAQLEKGRTRLNAPTLFGYQEGAIAESRGDLGAAVRCYTESAVAESPSSESRERLLKLARRPALRQQIEAGTADLLKTGSLDAPAIELRAGILEAEHRKEDLSRELKSAIAQTSSFNVLDSIASAARSHVLPDVEDDVLRRQIALTVDPVRNLQLRYQLIDFLEQRSLAAATQEIDAVYREHGKILGVVRATVDFNWNHNRKPQAIAVLLESAQIAYPELKGSFQLEAARKLTDLGEFARSRELLTAILGEKPLNAEYETAMAENLAHSNDSAGLEKFYRSQLDLLRKSNFQRDEKQQRIGQLRRGMIATATLLGRTDDAVDQYIELINAFPDDAGLAQEAALYAVAHGARDRLFGFYQKAISDSPRDPRWSIVLARLATSAEDNQLAIEAYGKAIKLRPERQDLYIAQASLEQRTRKFDDAIALYRKLYVLSYRDPQWIERIAELSARQGRAVDAVKALEAGYIEGRPAKAANSFAVAERLEKWGLLDEARRFAEQGVEQAGGDLLVSEQSGAATYARILARERQSETAFQVLSVARDRAPKMSLSSIAQQAIRNGVAAVTDEEWRKQREEERRIQATAGFAGAMKAMGSIVSEFYTPEEKAGFASLIQQKSAGVSVEELKTVYLPAARAADLAQLSADMMWTVAIETDRTSPNFNEWIQFQKKRVQMRTVATELEKYAPSAGSKHQAGIWRQAAEAYRAAGDSVGELRATENLAARENLQAEELLRYYRLLLAQKPDALIRLAASDDSAVQYLVRNGNDEQALSGIRTRAAKRAPVWKDSYVALAGLYRHLKQPEIDASFSTALDGEANIGERIARPTDRRQHMAGDVWFYYGSRFGEQLDSEQNSRAEDYLESDLEHTPGSPDAYLRVADYASQMNRKEAALVDYQHSLDLHGDQPAVLDSIAQIQWNAGRHAEALSAWSNAVKHLSEEMDSRHVPETFWIDFENVLGSIAARGQFDSVREPVNAMLRVYVARNGNYRIEPLLRAGYRANGNSVDWLLKVTEAASSQESVLNSIIPNTWSTQEEWIEKKDLGAIYARILQLAEKNATRDTPGYYGGVESARRNYIQELLDEDKLAGARAALSKVPEDQQISALWLPIVLQIADKEGSLHDRLSSWSKSTTISPSDLDLRNSATGLSKNGRGAVMRFVYERTLEHRELSAPNFLGLAAIDIDENRTADAVRLLKRLISVSNNMYTDMDSAAHLLEERHMPAEALEFLRRLADDSPWRSDYKVRLANAMLAVNARDSSALDMLKLVVADPKAAYADRVLSARALKGQSLPTDVSEELKLLAGRDCPQAVAESKPFFVPARTSAAQCSSSAKLKEQLLGEALALAPSSPSIRMDFVWAAFAANFDSRALVAAEPYLRNSYYYAPPEYGNDMSGEDGESASGYESRTAAGMSLASMSPNDAVKLIRLSSNAYIRKREYSDAAQIITQAQQILRDANSRQVLSELLKHVNDEIDRVKENDDRSPAIHADLDQDHVVRGRLLAGMPTPPRPRQEDEQ